MERVQDRLHDTIRVSQHVVVPEAQDEIAHGFQDRGSCPVLFGPLRVLPAIELHDHASICANKIDHVAIDRRLPAKLPTGEAAVAQTEPQHAFRVGLVATQASGYADLASHALAPSPQPSPRWGEGARRVRCLLHALLLTVRTQANPLAPPLPGGERSAREARRVRGQGLIESHLPPHPNPLPSGEREHAEFCACSCRPLLVRTQGAPLAPPLPGGERWAGEARRVRGEGPSEVPLPPPPTPPPGGGGERPGSPACPRGPLLVRTRGAPLAPPPPGGERWAREARGGGGQGPIESPLPP